MSDIIISTPTGFFEVEIKDSDNNTVYGPTTQGNAPFDPGITTPGDYVIYVTFDGNTNGWCWNIPSCLCPIPTDAVLFEEGGIRYLELTFDIPDLDEFCPFHIVINQSTGGSGSTFPVTVLNIGQLTFVSGTTYTKTITLWPTTIYADYQTFQATPGLALDITTAPKCMQQPVMVQYSCISPETQIADISIVDDQDTGDVYLRIGFLNHCDDYTCNEMTLNYIQIGSGAVDSGSYSFVADCSNFPLITYMDFLLSPTTGPFPPQRTYKITLNSCCGLVYNDKTVHCSPMLHSDIASMEILLIASTYVLRIGFNNCGTTCHDFRVQTLQKDLPLGGTPDGDNVVFTPDCDAPFPQYFDLALSPNLVATDIKYNVIVGHSPCCNTGLVSQLVTYT